MGWNQIILPFVSLQEPQPANFAESVLVTKLMAEIARKNKEIEQLRMQLKMQIEESERKIQDLEAENQMLKEKLLQKDQQLQHEIEEYVHRRKETVVRTGVKEEKEAEPEKVQYCFL